jgi:hypothetical protein
VAVNPAEWVLNNPTVTVTVLLAVVALAWAYDAYQDAEDRAEAARGFLGNARESTGGWLNVALVGLVGVVGGIGTAGMTAAEAVGWIAGVVPDFPVLAGGVLTVSLGALGLSGVIELPWWQFGLAGLFVLLLGTAWRLQE